MMATTTDQIGLFRSLFYYFVSSTSRLVSCWLVLSHLARLLGSVALRLPIFCAVLGLSQSQCMKLTLILTGIHFCLSRVFPIQIGLKEPSECRT